MSQLPELPPIPDLPSDDNRLQELLAQQVANAPVVRESDIQLPEIPRITAGAIESGDNRPLDEKIDELLTMLREIKDKLESGEYFKLG